MGHVGRGDDHCVLVFQSFCYGLTNFVRPQGVWAYVHKPCPAGHKAIWKRVTWNATTPPATGVTLRVRTGETLTALGAWSVEFSKSPAEIGPGTQWTRSATRCRC